MRKLAKVRVELDTLGMASYELLDVESGETVPFYSDYLHKLISNQISGRKQSQNTIDAIANDLKVFFEYVVNAQDIYFEKNIKTDTTLLADIVLSYPDYLVLGSSSKKTIARETAIYTGHNQISKVSANRYLSSVNGFMEASAVSHERMKEAKSLGLIDIDVAPENIYMALLNKRNLSPFERKRLQQQSVLSQVIQGGAKYTKTRLFHIPSLSSGSVSSDYKHFPLSHIELLLNNAPTYRDRALWALMLGTGIRMSEACQILLTDIDIVKETLKIFSYRDRVACFEGVDDKDIGKLSFKGRETENAYFIHPFNIIFFDSITQYLKNERPRGLQHNYLFVTNSNRGRGRPLFAISRSNRAAAFIKTQELIDCPFKTINKQRFTLHSMRHFYGYWLLNFHKTPAGHSFSLLEVQHMMGHAEINSTRRYAITDKIIAKEKMRLANLVLQNKILDKDRNLFEEQSLHVISNIISGI